LSFCSLSGARTRVTLSQNSLYQKVLFAGWVPALPFPTGACTPMTTAKDPCWPEFLQVFCICRPNNAVSAGADFRLLLPAKAEICLVECPLLPEALGQWEDGCGKCLSSGQNLQFSFSEALFHLLVNGMYNNCLCGSESVEAIRTKQFVLGAGRARHRQCEILCALLLLSWPPHLLFTHSCSHSSSQRSDHSSQM
jgi:hypothetical protein